ncbi:hypothetical protein NZA98_02765, partial [Escherichia coli]|nr:hypothetical protein [Escherichia coli]
AAVAGLVANAASYPQATSPEALRGATMIIFAVSTMIGLAAMIAGFALPLRRKTVFAADLP